MITTYHRPKTLDEALKLLTQPNTVPLGGGTLLSHGTSDSVSVVDLQLLKLDSITKKGNDLEIGATCTLQSLFESEHCPEALKIALKLEAPLNIRNSATVAGTVVSSDGRSTFVTMLLALDAKLDHRPLTADRLSSTVLGLSEYLLTRPKTLITSISIPLNAKTAFEYVSKTPADKPIVCASLAQWNSGRTRLTLGGYGRNPLLAMDGTESNGVEEAARNAYHEATDEWASAEYRMEMAAVLSKRCLENIK
ncbi:MAG: FAD binding domain-containing protein [Anaerolineales bacterium]|nr:FAD binding domain-containing protein [Anaerolineales bacterium]